MKVLLVFDIDDESVKAYDLAANVESLPPTLEIQDGPYETLRFERCYTPTFILRSRVKRVNKHLNLSD